MIHRVGVCVLLVLVGAVPALAVAPPRTWPAQQRQKMQRERERLRQEALQQHGAGNLAATCAAMERMIAIDEQTSPLNPERVTDLDTLARLYEQQDRYVEAGRTWKRAYVVCRWHLSERDWRTRQVSVSVADSERMARMAPRDRERLREATRLNDRMLLLYQQGKFEEAVGLAQRVLRTRKELLGETHHDYAQALNNLGGLYQAMGESRKALPLLEKALAIRAKALGETHPAYALNLQNLGVIYEAMGEYHQALTFFQKALAVRKEVVGEEHPDYAVSLHALGKLYKEMGESERALHLLQKALTIRTRVLGEAHPDSLVTLTQLATVYQQRGDYAKALAEFQKTIVLWKKTRGETHPDYAAGLGNLGVLLAEMGEHDRALPLLQRAHDILRSSVGKKDPNYAASVQALGMCCLDMGKYARALSLYRQAVQLRKAALGESHPAYAVALNNLALVHHALGEYDEALVLLKKALAIRKAALGESHPDYAQALHNLAGLYHAIGDYRHALPLYRQALAIRKATLGETHPYHILSVGNLATLYKEMGDFERAEALYQRALALYRKGNGEATLESAVPWLNLAVLYQDHGQYSRSLPMLGLARRLFRDRVGEMHPQYAHCLTYLAADYWVTGQLDQAEKLLGEGLAIRQRNLDDTFSALSERQRLALLERTRNHLDLYLSLAARPGDCDVASLYARVLSWKGMVAARQAEEKLLRDQPELAGLLGELRTTRAGLARLATQQVVPAQRDAWLLNLRELQQRKEILEGQLAEKSAAFRAGYRVTPEAVSKALPAGAVLIDLLEYSHSTPPAGRARTWQRQRRLLAFVLRANAAPILVALGDADPVDRAVAQWRRSLGGDEPARRAAQELRRLVWLPIEKHLGKKDVLIAADGALALMPFAALPGSKKDTYLIEERAIAHVPSGLHLLALAVPSRPAPDRLLALGGLDFGKGGRWSDLPGSRAEARKVRDLFRATHDHATVHLLEGPTGDRAGLLRELAGNSQRWRYVHLATHAYYDAPRQVRSLAALRGGVMPAGGEELPFVDHPLLLSGVVLAGANGNPAEGALTAEEVGSLDLRGCDLVVLSACETALGEVKAGEGVLGLQRSFHLAGARSVMSSLWSVHDEATQVLMRRFYEQLWGPDKPTRLEALRRAQLGMLRQGLRDPQLVRGVFNPKTGAGKSKSMPAVKDGGGRLAPAYWAAFVLSGDWR